MTPAVLRVERGSGHVYETADGQPVPGVTTILKALDKPALIPWAANTTAGYAVDHWDELGGLPPSQRLDRIKKEWRGTRDRAAVRGTQVHSYAEALATGVQVDVPADLMPYVEPAARWLDDWQAAPVHLESVVYSVDPLYAGTLDGIFDVTGGRRVLVDWKTTGSGVYPETSLQLAAYRWADRLITADGLEVDMPDVDEAMVLWLPGDGTSHTVPVLSDHTVMDVFEHLCRVWPWTKRGRAELVGRDIPPPVRELPGQEALV